MRYEYVAFPFIKGYAGLPTNSSVDPTVNPRRCRLMVANRLIPGFANI